MLPNHSPLVIAEQFGTLASLFPGRIDLGVGRAPGSDQLTSRALRRTSAAADTFPQDVVELMAYFQPVQPGQLVRAVPGAGLDVPIWILGSSLFGAQLAAALGLPFAFASHFAPAMMEQALEIYRARFEPSPQLDRPYVMLGLNVFAADSDDEARRLFTSLQQAFINLRRGRPGPLPPPAEGFHETLLPHEKQMLAEMLSAAVVGDAETVARGIDAFAARTGADEIMMTSQAFDHSARLRSFEIAATAAVRQ
jgi:luciferase family oxidoreductase group 1